MVPIIRSAYEFCHGDRAAVRTSAVAIAQHQCGALPGNQPLQNRQNDQAQLLPAQHAPFAGGFDREGARGQLDGVDEHQGPPFDLAPSQPVEARGRRDAIEPRLECGLRRSTCSLDASRDGLLGEVVGRHPVSGEPGSPPLRTGRRSLAAIPSS